MEEIKGPASVEKKLSDFEGVVGNAEVEPAVNVEKDEDPKQGMPMSKSKTQRTERSEAEHVEEFTRRTGMTPARCYQLVLVSLIARIVGACWVGMVAIEYTRYYVLNDLASMDFLRTATGSPQYIVQAFLFPFWGVISDRVSRKMILVAASLATCASAWLLTVVPSVEVYIITKVFALVADIGGPIRDAMLRDIFSAESWEKTSGGVTGLKAQMSIVGQLGFGAAMLVGMTLLKLGDIIGFPNEYTVHKWDCGEMHCVKEGQFSWNGGWHIDGCLRLLMIMGSIALSVDACITIFLFPETLPLEYRSRHSVWGFMKENWRLLGPWNNLRVLATPQIRSLMAIRWLGYVTAAGGGSIFMSFYSRFQFDTFTMMVHTLLAGTSTWFTTMAVSRLVTKFGDMGGVWLPGAVLGLFYGISCAILPPEAGWMVNIIWPAFAGPAFALGLVSPELIAKLVPSDVQGTYQTAKSFIFRITMAIMAWPWNQLFMHTQTLAYPFDASTFWVANILGLVSLVLILWKLRSDPRKAIERGEALTDFFNSPYAKGPWYQRHRGIAGDTGTANSGPGLPGGAVAEFQRSCSIHSWVSLEQEIAAVEAKEKQAPVTSKEEVVASATDEDKFAIKIEVLSDDLDKKEDEKETEDTKSTAEDKESNIKVSI
eukprot:TRINITY_DN81864_c0_g1_i1.p1 TRINITY_DN81864_c0_g1~~TRINITY_DN81864_c0_g1_i1.p1  ORF type:complete len:655 (-),score=106.70 TRINITY_DN81864_c0_g1_i1:337-2301(-)